MLPSEEFRVLTLLVAVLFVYGMAAVFLLNGIRGLIARRVKPQQRWVRWLRRVVFVLAAVGILCAAYGYFIEPRWSEVTHVRITTSKLPPGSPAIRIVHISDLHCDTRVRLERRLPDEIAALKPDLVVFTGDALNSKEALPVFRQCMTRIARIAPTFAVRGNFDVWYWQDLDLFGGTGVVELGAADGGVVVNLPGASVCVIGIPVGYEAQTKALIQSAPPDMPVIFLYHYPDLILDVAALGKVTLYCAGHTHGGQVALPGYGALVTLSKFDKRFESGLYREGDTWLYVNRGIGMEGGDVPRVRFMARPEITLIELAPEH